MKTKAQLRRSVLASMTVIDPEETPSADHASLLDLTIDGARAILLEKGLCWWDEDAIPDAVFIPFSRFVRALSCTDFGRGGKGYEAEAEPARIAIAGLKSSDEREDVPGDYS